MGSDTVEAKGCRGLFQKGGQVQRRVVGISAFDSRGTSQRDRGVEHSTHQWRRQQSTERWHL
jgi:hypothetical protein